MTEQNNITIQINGKSITCKPGQNIIDVADEHGIYIPVLLSQKFVYRC